MVKRWIGSTITFKDGSTAKVEGVQMSANQKINLSLSGRHGTFFLTTDEVALNTQAET